MRRFVFISLSLLLFSACIATKRQSSIIGQFKGRAPAMGSFVPSGEMELSLNADSSFYLHWLSVDYTGRWEVLDENNILLKFDKLTDVLLYITSGVISDEERTIKVINKNKIYMIGFCVLKRVKT
jgi:hypothetical protein